MRRYPSKNGIALPVTELGYETVPYERLRTNNHHLYFEKKWYHDVRYRSVFRNLVTHVQTMIIPEHDELHDIYAPPVMPRDVQMIDTVDDYLAEHGVIHCVKEKKTNEVYQIQASEWQVIKGLYRKVA